MVSLAAAFISINRVVVENILVCWRHRVNWISFGSGGWTFGAKLSLLQCHCSTLGAMVALVFPKHFSETECDALTQSLACQSWNC